MKALNRHVMSAVDIVIEPGDLLPVVGWVPVASCLGVVFELIDEASHITIDCVQFATNPSIRPLDPHKSNVRHPSDLFSLREG